MVERFVLDYMLWNMVRHLANDVPQLSRVWALPDDEDSNASDWKTEEELILEKQAGEMAEQKRIERAIAFSDGYKEKLKQLRKSRPGSEHFKSLQKLQKKQQQV